MAIKSTMTARMQMSILSIALIVSLHQAQFAASDDKLRELARHGGIVTIKLIEAHVPDMDPLPLQKESDVMAKVYQLLMSQQLQRDQQSQSQQQQQQQQNLSQFLSKSLICETQTIQDDNSPKVSPNLASLVSLFACQTSWVSISNSSNNLNFG